MIVETLAAFFANRPSDEFIFCSGNTAHFAKWNDQQKRHDMHPSIASDLPSQTSFYKDLPSLIRGVLQTSVQPDEVARYSQAELSIATPQQALRSGWQQGRDGGFTSRQPALQSGKRTIQLRAEDGPAWPRA
jgi:hypothetical protein